MSTTITIYLWKWLDFSQKLKCGRTGVMRVPAEVGQKHLLTPETELWAPLE